MAALWGNGGQAGQFPLEQWFYEMPPVTRWWTTATVAMSVLVQCHILTPFQLFYSFRAVYFKSQVRCWAMEEAEETKLTMKRIVLASSHDISLFWTSKSGLTIPCLLPTTILASSWRILWSLSSWFLVAAFLRHGLSPGPLPFPLPSVLGHCPFVQFGLYLGSPQPRNPA